MAANRDTDPPADWPARKADDGPPFRPPFAPEDAHQPTTTHQLFRGRDRILRNVLIAMGNTGDLTLADKAVRLLEDPSPLVRAMAVWALGRLLDADAFAKLRTRHLAAEADPAVRAEWTAEDFS